MEEMIKAEQVRLEGEKQRAEEEEHCLDEAHREWRLEEARQAPEEEEEAEAELSAPKKEKSQRSGK